MPTTTPSVHDALFTAAKAFTPSEGKKFFIQGMKETDTEYLNRLVQRIAEIPQENFDALQRTEADPPDALDTPDDQKKPPTPAQEWFNSAADALNESRPVSAPEGFTSRYKTPAPSAAAPQPAPTPSGPRAPRKRAEITVGKVIRMALINDQSTTMTQIKELLVAAGFKNAKDTTVGAYVSDTRETLRVAAEMGRFQPNPEQQLAA